MSKQRDAVLEVIRAYRDPAYDADLETAGALRSLQVEGGIARLELLLGYPAARWADELAAALRQRLLAVKGVEQVEIRVDCELPAHLDDGGRPADARRTPVSGVRNIIAVASAKGGVGKSTTAANLALALAAEGARAGVLDADIYGPSQPRMLGLSGERPVSTDGKSLEPLRAHGLEVMSIGFLVDEEQAMVWRGPMVTQALNQLLYQTRWSDLDYLIVDMPPGTGDIQLTLAQRVPVSGAVIVTTPQDIALADARRGLAMFRRVEVPVLGLIENMSTHICSKCGHEEPIFGAGGGARMADQYNVRLLGQLPLDIAIREQTDGGRPSVVAEPDGTIAATYRHIARAAAAELARSERPAGPKISVEAD